MNNTADLAKAVTEVYAQANVNVDDFPPNSRASHEIVKRQAQDRLAELTEKYKAAINDSIGCVLLYGDPERVQKFLKHLPETECNIVLDARDMYQEIAEVVHPMIGNDRKYTPNHMAKIMQLVMELARDNGIEIFDNIEYQVEFVQNTLALRKIIQRGMRKQYTDKFNLQVIKNRILNKAFEQRFSGTALPVVLHGLSPEEAEYFARTIKTNVCLNLDDQPRIDKKLVTTTIQDLVNILNNK